MIRRAIVTSAIAHGLLLAFVVWRISVRHPEPRLEIQAPLGDVYAGTVPEKPAPVRPAGNLPAAGSAEPPSASPGVPSGEARPVGEIRPVYPAISRKLGEEGEAVFALRIGRDGRVEEATLEKSTGFPRLDEAARAALVGAHFVSDGQTEAKRFHVEFRLR